MNNPVFSHRTVRAVRTVKCIRTFLTFLSLRTVKHPYKGVDVSISKNVGGNTRARPDFRTAEVAGTNKKKGKEIGKWQIGTA